MATVGVALRGLAQRVLLVANSHFIIIMETTVPALVFGIGLYAGLEWFAHNLPMPIFYKGPPEVFPVNRTPEGEVLLVDIARSPLDFDEYAKVLPKGPVSKEEVR